MKAQGSAPQATAAITFHQFALKVMIVSLEPVFVLLDTPGAPRRMLALRSQSVVSPMTTVDSA
jgi:hypothetical protein